MAQGDRTDNFSFNPLHEVHFAKNNHAGIGPMLLKNIGAEGKQHDCVFCMD